MKKTSILLLLVFAAALLFASFDAKESDRLFYIENDYEADFAYLEKALSTSGEAKEKAEILWRMSRTRLTLTDENKDKLTDAQRLEAYGDYGANDKPKAGDKSSAYYYAYASLEANPTGNGYHWMSSAVGRAGQEHGALNSLKKADPMRKLEVKAIEEYDFDLQTDAWYVLGILYNALPGKPISFGNNDFAISYMRKCLATQDMVNRTNGSNYLELAEQLWARNWDAKKRSKEFSTMLSSYNKSLGKGVVEACKYFEGYVSSQGKPFYMGSELSALSDREEAIALVNYGLSVVNAKLPSSSGTNKVKLTAEKEKLEKALKDWK